MQKETSQKRIDDINKALNEQIQEVIIISQKGDAIAFTNLTIQEKEQWHIYIAKMRDYNDKNLNK